MDRYPTVPEDEIWPSCKRIVDYIVEHRAHNQNPRVVRLFMWQTGKMVQSVLCAALLSEHLRAFVIVTPADVDSPLDSNEYQLMWRNGIRPIERAVGFNQRGIPINEDGTQVVSANVTTIHRALSWLLWPKTNFITLPANAEVIDVTGDD